MIDRLFLHTKNRGILILIALLAFGPLLVAQSFTVQINSNKIVAGERFSVKYLLEGAQSNPSFPDFSPLKIEGGPNVASNFLMVNGKVSQNVSYNFVLKAPKEGTYTIGPATVKVGGKTLKTQSIRLVASKAPPIPEEGKLKGKDVFIIPTLSKDEVFVGERLTVTYELYTVKNVRDLDLAKNPVFDGFGVEINPNLAQFPRDVELNGIPYRVVNVKQFHLFPQQAGEINIPNLTFRGMISERTNRNDPFSMFSIHQRTSRLLTSAKKTVTVKPWPANPPEDFSGLVGLFSFDASLNKTSLNTGEVARLRMLITGEGNIRLQGTPTIKTPESFDVFDPEPREAVRVNAEAVNGQKVFDFLLAPRQPGLFQLPSATVSFLNPETGQYERIRANLPALTVGGKAIATEISPAVIGAELENDIRPLQAARPIWYKPAGSLWIPLGVAPLILLVVFGFWIKKKADKEALPETALRRSMEAAKRQLAEAQALLEKGEPKAFYNELNRTLWAYLEDRLALPGSSQTRSALTERLTERTIPPEQQTHIFRLLDESEMAVYAPGAVAPPKDAYAQALDLLDQLESQFNPEL